MCHSVTYTLLQTKYHQYELVGVIGKGSFGTVSRIRRKADGRIMVWKELNYGTMLEKEKQLVVSEVSVMTHPMPPLLPLLLLLFGFYFYRHECFFMGIARVVGGRSGSGVAPGIT